VAGNERVLLLYKATDRVTSSLKSLLLKRLPRSGWSLFQFYGVTSLWRTGVADIEELFLQRLTINQAKLLIRRNMNTMLCYMSGEEPGLPRAHILNLMR
jgi:hypothetical protein